MRKMLGRGNMPASAPSPTSSGFPSFSPLTTLPSPAIRRAHQTACQCPLTLNRPGPISVGFGFPSAIEPQPFNTSGHFGDAFRGRHPKHGVLALKWLQTGSEDDNTDRSGI